MCRRRLAMSRRQKTRIRRLRGQRDTLLCGPHTHGKRGPDCASTENPMSMHPSQRWLAKKGTSASSIHRRHSDLPPIGKSLVCFRFAQTDSDECVTRSSSASVSSSLIAEEIPRPSHHLSPAAGGAQSASLSRSCVDDDELLALALTAEKARKHFDVVRKRSRLATTSIPPTPSGDSARLRKRKNVADSNQRVVRIECPSSRISRSRVS
jgi:hypothetical protein